MALNSSTNSQTEISNMTINLHGKQLSDDVNCVKKAQITSKWNNKMVIFSSIVQFRIIILKCEIVLSSQHYRLHLNFLRFDVKLPIFFDSHCVDCEQSNNRDRWVWWSFFGMILEHLSSYLLIWISNFVAKVSVYPFFIIVIHFWLTFSEFSFFFLSIFDSILCLFLLDLILDFSLAEFFSKFRPDQLWSFQLSSSKSLKVVFFLRFSIVRTISSDPDCEFQSSVSVFGLFYHHQKNLCFICEEFV